MSWLLSPAADTIELGDLEDVTITSVGANELIQWNGSIWINRTLAEAGILAIGAEINDLTAAVTWANIPDANVPESAVTQHEAALTILETQITDGALLARVADAETVSGVWSFTPGPILTALGSEGAPSRSFIGDLDTGDYSPGANIYAITVGGTEAVRWTGASPALVRWSMATDLTASTTQIQGESPLTGSWNEVSTVANKNDVVTLPSLTKGEMCLVINTSGNDLQVFPASGEDIGAGTNSSLKIKKNSSRYWLCYDTNTTSFDIATDFLKLQGIELDGASDNDLLYRSGGDWTHTGGNLTWDGITLTASRINSTKYIQLRTATTGKLNDITAEVNTNPGKIQGSVVYNKTTDNPVYAKGNADGDVWVDGIGTTVHTPIL